METSEKIRTYLSILDFSLERKEQALNQMIAITKRQSNALETQPLDLDLFSAEISQKEELIDEIDKIDTQFECLYEKIKSHFVSGYHEYIIEFQKLKEKIPIVIELGVILRALEQQNKIRLEVILSNETKDKIRLKKSSKFVTDNYKVANNFKNNKNYLNHLK